MGKAAGNPRDRCLVDLLGYTGQRLRVIQTLRLRDVDPDQGVYFMPDADGFKGADRTGKKRPLLGACRSVHDWLRDHPTGDPDDYLITAMECAPHTEPGRQMSTESTRERLTIIGKRVGLHKPVYQGFGTDSFLRRGSV